MPQERLIRKYSNRRLYDTSASRHVTLDDLRQLIVSGEKIKVIDDKSGEELWSGELPWGGYAPPATYQVHGRQFVVIAATGGGFPGHGTIAGPKEMGDAYVAFALRKGSVERAQTKRGKHAPSKST